MTSPEPAEAVRAGNRAHGFGRDHRLIVNPRVADELRKLTGFSDEGFDAHFIVDKPLTDEELDHLKAEWERKRHGHPKVLGLPRRVRIRLAVEQAVTDAGIWLCDHRMWRAAGLLWWRR